MVHYLAMANRKRRKIGGNYTAKATEFAGWLEKQ